VETQHQLSLLVVEEVPVKQETLMGKVMVVMVAHMISAAPVSIMLAVAVQPIPVEQEAWVVVGLVLHRLKVMVETAMLIQVEVVAGHIQLIKVVTAAQA
jgi:hypothetical protein